MLPYDTVSHVAEFKFALIRNIFLDPGFPFRRVVLRAWIIEFLLN